MTAEDFQQLQDANKEAESYARGYAQGQADALRDSGWQYFEESDPDRSKELLVVYYVNGVRHLGVSWGNWENFQRDILDQEPEYQLHAYRYLLEPRP